MSSKAPRYFELSAGSSHKFWEVSTSGIELTTRWGRIDTNGQSKTKAFADASAAEVAAARLIKQKLAEGYAESAGPGPKANPEPKSKPEPNRPINPQVAASVAETWQRIDTWLGAHAPALLAKMGKGAEPAAIARVEAVLGMELPDDVRVSYATHDGSGGKWFFPSGEWLSLDGMLIQYDCWQELVAELGFDEDEARPEGPIQPVHYHLQWIPLTHDGAGDHTLIDLAPAQGGKVGQLIDFNHETGPERVAAPSLAAYLVRFADALVETGIEPSSHDSLSWFKEIHTPRSAFPTAAQQAAMHAADRARELAMRSSRHYFEHSAGASHRFWEVVHDEKQVTTRSGTIGANGRTTTTTHDSTRAAYDKAHQAIAKKIKAGYVEKT